VSTFADQVLAASDRLKEQVNALEFTDPVTHVYNPLAYAAPLHSAYVRKWGASRRRVLLLGMNPGPWGMVQTGVPFGEIAAVKDWLGLDAPVERPNSEHPRRPVQGLACPRSEVSGRRLWGLFRERFGRPEAFFADHFVVNYCPLAFLEQSGRNRTPDKLPAAESAPLFAACDHHLLEITALFQPEWLVGVGGFAAKKLARLFPGRTGAVSRPRIGTVLHPSPASPAANRGWAEAATRQLQRQDIWPQP
jgi:single-strand selective monofunctional uracil DNA glycosylase